jgi:PAS domain S-box-containing protein
VSSYKTEKRYVRSDGTTMWVQVDAALVRDEAGRPLHSLGIVQDITERKRAETALRESEERYRTVVETQTELICRYLPDTTLTWMNEAYCRYFGRSREELEGTKFLALVPEHERAAVRRHLAIVIETGASHPMEHEVILADGSIGWQQWNDHVIRGEDDRIVELQGIGRDITERKRAEQALRDREEALRRSHRQIRALAGRLLTAGEEERRRLARELHDDVNQRVAALAIALGTARRRLVDAPAVLATQLGDLETRALELATDLRRVSHDLHPAVLEHAGLAVALRAQCGEVSRVAGVPVTLDIQDGISVGPDTALCLYRVAQEALRNVVKHAGAGRIEVSLGVTAGDVVLVVSDDGRGFDPGLPPLSGLGLVSMEERVRLLRGSLKVRSAPRQGTHVCVRIPADFSD